MVAPWAFANCCFDATFLVQNLIRSFDSNSLLNLASQLLASWVDVVVGCNLQVILCTFLWNSMISLVNWTENQQIVDHTSKSGWTIHHDHKHSSAMLQPNSPSKLCLWEKHFISNVLTTEPPWVLLWKLFRHPTSTNSTDKHDFSWFWRRNNPKVHPSH